MASSSVTHQLGHSLAHTVYPAHPIFHHACFSSDAKKEEAKEAGESSAVNEEVEKLKADLATQAEAVKDMTDKYKRSLAESENLRRRSKLDVEDAHKYAVKKFASGLLEVADNLGRALKYVPEEVAAGPAGDANPNAALKSLFDGVKGTEKVLLETFSKHKVVRYDPIGEVFDPNFAQALVMVDDESKDPNTVMEVVQMGYLLNDRVLRAADVIVVKKR